MEKLEQLRKKIEEIQTKSVVSTEMKAFIKLVLEISNKNKDELAKLSNDNIKIIENSIDFIKNENSKLLKGVTRETSEAKEEFNIKLKELNKRISEVKNGEDGHNPSPEEVVPFVLKKLPTPKELDGEDIANKLESLKGNDRLDKKAIKGLEELEKQVSSISSRSVISGGITQAKVLQLIDENASNSPLTTKGDLYTYSTEDARLPVGTNGQVLSADSTVATGLKWIAATSSDEKVKYDASDPTAGYVADKIVAGTGISVAEGTGANENKLVVTNSSPDQTVAITDSGIAVVTGIYPNFNIDVPATDLSGYLPLAGGIMTGNILMTSNKLIGGSTTTSDLYLQTTTGVGTTGADMHFLVGNNGATEAMTILNDGKIGMGITAPTKALHVVGANDATGATLGLRDSAGYALGVGGGISFQGIYTAGGGATNFGLIRGIKENATVDNQDGALTFATDLAGTLNERFRITSTGNVAIGTTDLDGTPAIGRLTIKGTTNDGTTNILVGRDSDEANVFSVDTDGVTTASRIIVESATYPVAKVTRLTSETGGSLADLTGLASGINLITKSSGDITDGFGGGFIFSGTDTGVTDAAFARIYGRRDGADTEGALQFIAGTGGQEIFMTIRASGNVGIGTTGPGAKLDVQGAGGGIITNFQASSDGTSRMYSMFQNTGGNLLWGLESSTGGSLLNSSTGLAYASVIGSWTNTPFQLVTNGTAKVTIDSSGNVGIGTTAPGGQLELAAAASASNELRISADFNSSYNSKLNFNARSIYGTWVSGMQSYVPGNSTLGLQFYTSNNTPTSNVAMTILGTGNVGIGTTSPLALLHSDKAGLTTDTGGESARFQGTVTGSGTNTSLRITNYVSSATAANRYVTMDVFDHNPTSRALVLQSTGGSVGIGTTAPANLLHVNGAAQATTIELGHASDTTIARVSAGVVSIEGQNILTAATGLPLAGGTMTGDITLGENASIAHDPSLSADGKYTGETITGTAGAALAFGDLIYLDPTDSRWELADANSAAAADGDARGILGFCVLAAAGDGSATKILLSGFIRADTAFPALTINAPAYVGETAGDIVTAIPTTTDAVQRVVGFGFTADVLMVGVSPHYQTAV